MSGPWDDYAPSATPPSAPAVMGPWADYQPGPQSDPAATTRPTIADMRSFADPGYAKARAKLQAQDQARRAGNAKLGAVGRLMTGADDFTSQVAGNTGAADEIAGGIGYLTQGGVNLYRRMTGQPIDTSAAAAGQAATDYERERQAGYAAEHPVLAPMSQVATFASMAKPMTASPIPPMTAAKAGAVAAGTNAPFALARQKGSLAQRLPGAAAETAIAGAAGAGLQAASNALGASAARAAAAPPSDARTLANEGVELTPGQMLGGSAQRVEDALTSVPVVGDAIRSAKIRGIESFDRAAFDRALGPIGQSLPPNINVGRDAMGAAEKAVSGAYQSALSGVTVTPDAQYLADVNAVLSSPHMPASVKSTIASAVSDAQANMGVSAGAAGVPPSVSGPVPGEVWKAVDAKLGALQRSASAGAANNPDLHFAADALGKLQQAHADLLARTDPSAAAAVSAADRATANLVRLRQASQYTGTAARGGVFTPSDLNRAVQGMDTSAGNRAYARGGALLQDLTDPASRVLPSTVPDSGTPIRSLLASAAGGLGGIAGGSAVGASPVITPTVVATGGMMVGGAAAYSRPVIAALNQLYRAATPGAARAALAGLTNLAAHDVTALAALRTLDALPPQGAGQPGQQPAPQVSMTRR